MPAHMCPWPWDLSAALFQVPMEYNHLQDTPVVALRNRLLLLHHVSELFCPCIPMFDLEGALDDAGLGPSVGFHALRGILISQGKVLVLTAVWAPGCLCNIVVLPEPRTGA